MARAFAIITVARRAQLFPFAMNKTKMTRRPTWTRSVSISACSEVLDLGRDAVVVRKELAAKARHADTQEVPLAVIWKLLSSESRAAIERAWKVELEGTPLRADRRRRRQGASPTAPPAADGSE